MRNNSSGHDQENLSSNEPLDLYKALEAERFNPVVGLSFITEFTDPTHSSHHPYYHCCLPDCRDACGNAKKMKKHIFTVNHKSAWLKHVHGLTNIYTRGEDVVQFANDNTESLDDDYKHVKTEDDEDKYQRCKQGIYRADVNSVKLETKERKFTARTIKIAQRTEHRCCQHVCKAL